MSYNTYLHYFLLYNATPPHNFVAASAPFCFAAAPGFRGRAALWVSAAVRPSRGRRRRFSPLRERRRIPAGDRARCDLVQFVTSLARTDNGEAVVVAFGVNDCEAAFATLPVSAILAFAHGCRDRAGRGATLAHALAAHREANATEAAWNETRGAAWRAFARPDGGDVDDEPWPAPPDGALF